MKDDFSQDEKNFSKMNQTENSSSVNDDSLDWAKQVYLQLKQKQKEEKELCQKEIEESGEIACLVPHSQILISHPYPS